MTRSRAGARCGTEGQRRDADWTGSTAWTDFRGPKRDGEYREEPMRTIGRLAGLTPLWKQPVGGGYASFVIAEAAPSRSSSAARRRSLRPTTCRPGRELWTNGWRADFRESMGGDGPRATPTWSDGRVYALGATGELRALDDATGSDLADQHPRATAARRNLDWGMAASPLVVDDTVVVLPGGPDGRSVVGLRPRTGKRAWSALDDKQAYCVADARHA